MAQQTLVVKLWGAQQQTLRDRLNAGAFEWRSTPHARFTVKGEGVVATLYNSGKLVIQGPDPEAFVARFVEGEVRAAKPKAKATGRSSEEGDSVAQLNVTTIGSDETGKGDYFGPLVVSAVRLTPELAKKMADGGVMDSKKITDVRALELGAALRQTVPFSVVRVDPLDYNERYPNYSGLNPFLADLHAEAIKELVEPGVRVLVDKFAAESVMKKALKGLDIQLEQATRAERNMAVAAASIIARQEFLVGMVELSARFGVELQKGAGHLTDKAGARFANEHGFNELKQVAKLHFKNTEKVRAKLH